jgi:hypothetical protein
MKKVEFQNMIKKTKQILELLHFQKEKVKAS